jgi:hypothetical protein
VVYGTALSGAQLNASANVPGTFVYNPTNGTVLTAGTNLLTAIFTPTDTGDYTGTSASVSLVVSPAVPVITWSAPAPVVYGTALSGAQLNASANVPGTFVYNPTNGTVLTAGTNLLTATFTPTDASDYTGTSASVSLVVNQAVPLITWSAPASVVYGTALSGAQLNASANVPGAIVYNPTNGTVLSAGTNLLTATFTPTDTSDYTGASASVSLVVHQSVPVITWSAPAPVLYGTALSGAQLNASANVPGTIVYSPTNGAVLPAGTNLLTATFTPSDTNDYTGTSASVSLVVNQAVPLVTWNAPAPVVYGTALSGAQLNASANVPGTFVYNPTNGTVLTAGTNLLTATFTPTDTSDYTGTSASVSLVVNQAVPVITWSAPAPVVYGAALSGAQLNASANVPGTFVYNPTNGTVLTAGTNLLTATFTPTDASDYTGTSASVSLVVNQAVPVITWSAPAPLVYGTALSGAQLNGSANVPGLIVYNPTNGAILPAGTNLLTATFTPTDTSDYTGTSASVSLVVNRAVPVITWSTPAPVVYGTALGGAQLNASGNVPGAIVYNPTNGTVLTAGTNLLTATFTPTDGSDYTGTSVSVSLVVNQAVPVITWSAPAPVVYGTALSGAQLNASANVPGTIVYNPTNGTVLTAGTNLLTATFTPTDTSDYIGTSASVSLVVSPAVPVITWSAPAPVVYGTALSGAQLNASANVPGTFVYNPTNGTVLTAGTNLLTAIFTPTDTGDYTGTSASVSLVVSPAVPVITWSAPAPVVYGTALSGAQLNASANVPGTFVYNPTNGTVLTAGTNLLTATFTPTDASDYTGTSASVSLVVNQAVPLITWSAPASVVYGTALSGAQLNASANVPGAMVYNPTNGAVLTAGTNLLTATFTPADTNDYTGTSASVSLVVNQAVPVITWNAPAPVVYGTSLSGAQLNASANVPGAIVYNPTSGAILPAGTNLLTATFTPTDTSDYTGTSASVSLVVNQAVPVITWSAPAPVVYGTALSGAQLNASANIPGAIVYNPTNGTLLTAGTNLLTAIFTPTDTNDYTGTPASVSLVVNQAVPVITWSAPAPVVYGTALSGAQLNASANVPGAIVYNPTNGTILPAGTNLLTATFTPADTNDYTGTSASVSVVVNQAVPVITWSAPAPVMYGTALSGAQLNASANGPGTIVYNPTNGAVLSAGTNLLTATFTPANTNDYTGTSASVSLVVNQAVPVITWNAPAPVVYGTALSGAQLNASANVPGAVVYNPTNRAVLSAGTNLLTATFTPADTSDYTGASASVSLVVNQAVPVITWSAPAPVVYGTALSGAQLNASANVPGLMVYNPTNGATLPAGTNLLTATFTPTDTSDYTGASASVSLVVNQAVPVITWSAPAPVVYGTVLSGAQLNASANVPGAIVYNPTNGAILPAGTNLLTAIFTPADINDYIGTSASVSLVVNPAVPVITWSAPAPVVYGTALSGAQLNASANVPGLIVYNPTSGAVLPAGTNLLTASFTPTDTNDFLPLNASVPLVIQPATLTVTANNAAGVFGQPIPAFTGTVLGQVNADIITATFTCSAQTNSPPGNYPIVFTLSDPGSRLANYAVITNNGVFTLSPAGAPTIAMLAPNLGPTNGGTTVVISGTGFESGATVAFGSQPGVAATVVDPSTISLVTPPTAAGTVTVALTNADGQSFVLTNGFTFGGTAEVAGPITNPANGHLYYIVPPGTWTQAEAGAQTLGGNLVTIRSAAENNWIVSNLLVDLTPVGGPNLSGVPVWIGIHDPVLNDGSGSQHAADFIWADGEPVNYLNWNAAMGEPNNTGNVEYYGAINWQFAAGAAPAGTWNDTGLDGTPFNIVGGPGSGPYYGIAELYAAVITNQPVSQTVYAGSTVAFNVGAFGLAPLNYRWQQNGGNLTDGGNVFGSSSAQLQLTAVTAAAAGSYTVVLSNAFGVVTSAPATLTVLPPAISSFAPTSGQPGNVVVISGVGLLSVTNVSFNGLAAQYLTLSPNQIAAHVPAGAATGPLIVQGIAGQLVPGTFTVRSAAVCAPVPAGVISAYLGDGNASDAFGLHHGTLQNGVMFVPGFKGLAFSFDGLNSYVNLGQWSAGSAWTIEGWVNPSAFPSGRHAIAGGVNNCGDWALTMDDGQFGVRFDPPGGCTQSIPAPGPFLPNTWYHLAASSDGTNASIYVNGVLQNTAPVSPNYVGTAGTVEIGGEACCPGDNFPGLVDELAIYGRALNAGEIATLFDAGAAGKCLSTATNFAVTVQASPAIGGSVSGAGSFPAGSTVTVQAAPDTADFWVFSNWSENGFVLSTNPTYSFTLTSPQQLTANFVLGTNQIIQQPQSLAVESGNAATFQVTAFGIPPLRYQWFFANSVIPGATNSILVMPVSNAAEAGSFFVTVSGSSGTITSRVATLTVATTTVGITSPTNGASLIAPAALALSATATDNVGVREVDFYANSIFVGRSQVTAGAYLATATGLGAGSYALTAVAIDNLGLSRTSSVVNVTVNAPGTTLVDFENLDTSAGLVRGAALSNYLAGFGIRATNVTAVTNLGVVRDTTFVGGIARASSGHNYLTQSGASGAVSYTLTFAQPYATVSWVRGMLVAGNRGVIAPQWRAHALDSSGNEIDSAGEDEIISSTNVPAAGFTLYGPNIVAVRFDDNNNGVSLLTALPLDDLLLSINPATPPLTINLTTASGGTTFAAPGQVTLDANFTNLTSIVREVDFYEGGDFLGSVFPGSAIGTTAFSLSNLAPGIYNFTAVALDSSGHERSSVPLAITVNAAAGINVIDFDSLDASSGAAAGAALSNYLAQFGVTIGNVTVGTRLEAINGNNLTATASAEPSSPPNLFTQVGLNQPVTFTLNFASPQQMVSLTRVALMAGSSGVAHPQWTANFFDASGNILGSVGESLLISATNVPARAFQFSANGISSVQFNSDSRRKANFSAVLLDDLVLSTIRPAVTPLAVAISSPVNNSGFAAPAAITLSVSVTNNIGTVDHVSYYAGPNLIGSATASPYSYNWTGVQAGTYAVRAQVFDVSGATAYSSPITVNVTPGGSSTVVNFDAPALSNAPISDGALGNYLAGFGIFLTNVSPGTVPTVVNQSRFLGGTVVAASSPPNLLTQIGSNGPVSFTLKFQNALSSFSFTRPQLLAAPFASHPAWQVTAFDAAGVPLAQAQEGPTASFTNVNSQVFTLTGAGIASVQFASQVAGPSAFSGMLIDDLILTTNAAPVPPAIAITNPFPNEVFVTADDAPAVVPINTVTFDNNGISNVKFYSGGTLLGVVTAPPFTFLWTNSVIGPARITAVATDGRGLTNASPPVNITFSPAPGQFAILTEPAGIVAAAGSMATFSVQTTGTNDVTYQWFFDGRMLPNQTQSSLTLSPVADGDAGTYYVTVASGGVRETSAGATLTVVDPPVINLGPMGTNASPGADIVLTFLATGTPPLTYQWWLNGSPIPGATNGTYEINAAQPLDSGVYQISVQNQVAVAVSGPAVVSVLPNNGLVQTADYFSNRISIDPLLGPVAGNNQNATFESGEPLHDGKPGGKSIWYTWHASFTGIISLTTEGSDFDTLLAVYTGTNVAHLTPVAADDDSGGFLTSLVTFNVTQGNDYQIAVDGFRGASGNVILGMPPGNGYRVLHPNASNTVPQITIQPTNQLVQAGATTTLRVAARSGIPLSYQWHFQGSPINLATNSSLVLTNFQTTSVGLYDVLVANAAGAVESQTVSVQIASGGTNSVHDKFGDSVDLAGPTSTVQSVHVDSGGGDSRGFSVSQTFSTVGATKELGEPSPCGQAGGASQWYVYTAQANGTLTLSTAGSTFNTILGAYTGSGVNFASLTPVACGYTTNYQVNGQPTLVIPGVLAGTRFFIVVDGYLGASGMAQLHIGLGAPPSLVSPPASQLVAPGSNIVFNVQAVGSTNFAYQWRLNGLNIAGATNAALPVTNAHPANVGSYTVVVSNVVGVVTSAPPAVLKLQVSPVFTLQPLGQTVTNQQKTAFNTTVVGLGPLHYQWFFDGAPIARATNNSYGLPAAQFTNQGSYTLVVTNSAGAITSSVANLVVRDGVAPTLTVSAPANNFSVTAPILTVAGTAADNLNLSNVLVTVNNSVVYPAAVAGGRWQVNVTLNGGTNAIKVQSQDAAGNLSPPISRTGVYVLYARLTLETNGLGRIVHSATVTNNALLRIGNIYSVSAATVPGSNWLFHNWSAGISQGGLANAGTNPVLNFTMISNLVLQANFITNPFIAVEGAYNGLFSPSAGIAVQNSGFITVNVQSNSAGAYSAKLVFDGSTYNLNGSFNLNGAAAASFIAGGQNMALALNLNLAVPDNTMTGTLTAPAWTSMVMADRAVFSAAAPTSDYNGRFTMLIPPALNAPNLSPGGYGYAAFTNTAAGNASFAGFLADGSVFSGGAPVSESGYFPLFAQLYSGQGLLMGWLNFTNAPPKDLFGSVTWIKPATGARTFYPQGFTNSLIPIAGSEFDLPPTPFLNLTTADLTLTDGNLRSSLDFTNVAVFATNAINLGPSPTNKLAITFFPSNGTMSVTFRPTGATADTMASGAVLQDETNAAGWFKGTNQTGTFLLR